MAHKTFELPINVSPFPMTEQSQFVAWIDPERWPQTASKQQLLNGVFAFGASEPAAVDKLMERAAMAVSLLWKGKFAAIHYTVQKRDWVSAS